MVPDTGLKFSVVRPKVFLPPHIPQLVCSIQPYFCQIKGEVYRLFIIPAEVGLWRLAEVADVVSKLRGTHAEPPERDGLQALWMGEAAQEAAA